MQFGDRHRRRQRSRQRVAVEVILPRYRYFRRRKDKAANLRSIERGLDLKGAEVSILNDRLGKLSRL